MDFGELVFLHPWHEVTTVAYYYLSANALKQPMEVREGRGSTVWAGRRPNANERAMLQRLQLDNHRGSTRERRPRMAPLRLASRSSPLK